jgi:hypothetical protein
METKDSTAIERIILDFYSSDDENLTNCVMDIHAYYLKNILKDGFDADKAKIFLADYEDYKKGITHFDKYINKPNLPKYVRLGHTALRLKDGKEYYRDAGNWSVNFKYDGLLMSSSHIENLDNVALIQITQNEYEEENKGYLYDDDHYECPNCVEGLIVKIKGKYFCEDCHVELTEL